MKAEKRLATVLLSLTLLFVSGFFPAYGMSSCCLPDRSAAAAEAELDGFRRAETQQADCSAYGIQGGFNENTERDNGEHTGPV